MTAIWTEAKQTGPGGSTAFPDATSYRPTHPRTWWQRRWPGGPGSTGPGLARRECCGRAAWPPSWPSTTGQCPRWSQLPLARAGFVRVWPTWGSALQKALRFHVALGPTASVANPVPSGPNKNFGVKPRVQSVLCHLHCSPKTFEHLWAVVKVLSKDDMLSGPSFLFLGSWWLHWARPHSPENLPIATSLVTSAKSLSQGRTQ